MTGWGKVTARSRAAIAACLAVFFVPAAFAVGFRGSWRGGGEQHRSEHAQAPRPSSHAQASHAPSGARGQGRPANQRAPYPGPPYVGPSVRRPEYPGYLRPINPPAGHLQSWLDAHRNVPLQRQEQLLRSDPSFQRLLPGEQQRLMQQLRDVDSLTEQQRERRLARAENLEKLSPEERMNVNRSAREWTTLPPQRQALLKNAFHDLRAVPLDQRETVLNSQRYRDQFTPQERGILSELLKVEPYEPAHP